MMDPVVIGHGASTARDMCCCAHSWCCQFGFCLDRMKDSVMRWVRPLYFPAGWKFNNPFEGLQAMRAGEPLPEQFSTGPNEHRDLVHADDQLKWENFTWWSLGSMFWLADHGQRYQEEMNATVTRAIQIKTEAEGQITSREAVYLAWHEWLTEALATWPEPPLGWVRTSAGYVITGPTPQTPSGRGA